MVIQVAINCDGITDWNSFHSEFAGVFGFPEFYGRNGDAWADCMGSLDEDFSRVQVKPGEIVIVQLLCGSVAPTCSSPSLNGRRL